MVDINATIPILETISYPLRGVLDVVYILVGGIFGIYVIALIIRLLFFRKIYTSFKEIKISMKRMEAKIDKFGKKKQKP